MKQISLKNNYPIQIPIRSNTNIAVFPYNASLENMKLVSHSQITQVFSDQTFPFNQKLCVNDPEYKLSLKTVSGNHKTCSCTKICQ